MEPGQEFNLVEKSAFLNLLKQYPDHISSSSEKLRHLDEQRCVMIPNLVNERCNDPYLTQAEVVTLVEWKLSHGTYRPRLKSLVQQNPATDVKDATREAFNCYNSATPNAAIAKLTALKGIGPATASLLLSVYTSEAPFFSDELYRWAFFESGDTKGRGWDRPIKYNGKEYAALFNRVQELRERLQVSAVEAEKVAYVLGKGEATATSSGQKLEKSRKRKAEQSDDARVSRTRKGS